MIIKEIIKEYPTSKDIENIKKDNPGCKIIAEVLYGDYLSLSSCAIVSFKVERE